MDDNSNPSAGDRVVVLFIALGEKISQRHIRLDLKTLNGVSVSRLEGTSWNDIERQLRDGQYQHIPWVIAGEIDRWAQGLDSALFTDTKMLCQCFILNFQTKLETFPNGHCRLLLYALSGTVVEIFDGTSIVDVESKLKKFGGRRINSDLADRIDMLRPRT